METDSVTLVLWYRGDRTSSPIYSLDARSSSDLSLAKHHVSSSDLSLKDRIRFELMTSSNSSTSINMIGSRPKTTSRPSSATKSNSTAKAVLILDPVREEDSGVFLCRVDFKWERTLNTVTNLSVIGQYLLIFIVTGLVLEGNWVRSCSLESKSRTRQSESWGKSSLTYSEDEDGKLMPSQSIECEKRAMDFMSRTSTRTTGYLFTFFESVSRNWWSFCCWSWLWKYYWDWEGEWIWNKSRHPFLLSVKWSAFL